MPIKLVARAKINLCLHITGQRDDGYHLLDSIVGFADLGDVLTFTPADNLSLTIAGPFADGLAGNDDNLILRAARCFKHAGGAAIHLEKNLPIASGIGGGSADAAATLHGLSKLWNLPLPNAKTQLSLGADVPVCVDGRAVRMQAIGEDITPVSDLPALPTVLINPGVEVSTPAVFNALLHRNNPAIDMGEPSLEWLLSQRNDMQKPAISLAPVIADVLATLDHAGAKLARMSGSGATCFGVFDTLEKARSVASILRETHPEWWIQATVLNGSNHA